MNANNHLNNAMNFYCQNLYKDAINEASIDMRKKKEQVDFNGQN